jgi:oligosaccharyltransferase complex subunit gamma
MLWLPLLLLAPLAALAKDAQQTLVDLAAAGDGLIRLDAQSFDLLTAPNRNWSAAIQFTALDKRRRCEPCRSVLYSIPLYSPLAHHPYHREFDPSWNQVAKVWATTPKEHRDAHFFATIDFDNGQSVFQSASSLLFTLGTRTDGGLRSSV